MKLEEGLGKAAPLSALLFAFALEPLAIAIRRSDKIKGIEVGSYQLKITLYADDNVLFMTDLN